MYSVTKLCEQRNWEQYLITQAKLPKGIRTDVFKNLPQAVSKYEKVEYLTYNGH